MKVLSVAEAADELNVSSRRVLQLIASGQLHGEQLGWGWAVDPIQVDRFRNMRGPTGRPWSPASAWAVLALANGDEANVSAVERSRARKRLAQRRLSGLVDRLRPRAELHRLYVHPSGIDRLAGEAEVIRGGVSAASDHDADVLVRDVLEAYVARRSLAVLTKRYGLQENPERPNVWLRVVDDDVWPFESDAVVAPWPVVAVDLIESEDERSRRAGRELIERHA